MNTHGLYRTEDEHDSCGIGFVADIKGRKSHSIVQRGLAVLERMEHRGAESADNQTGDGAGILLHIPHDLYRNAFTGLPEPGYYGTGLVFFFEQPEAALKTIADRAAKAGFLPPLWRAVPVNAEAAGQLARAVAPTIQQIILIPQETAEGADTLETKLYWFRKTLEQDCPTLYVPSLSSRIVVYKGMLMPTQLRHYFADLQDPLTESAVALVHSRFSTNTFPDWTLAQPFRLVAHNGEINTITGNRFWMQARHALFHGEAAHHTILEAKRSDSASFDNVLELLVRSGRTLPHALMMMIPESFNDKNPISQELKDFYEYHACMMEPWDGPASIVFCDGRYVGGTLDRNGLRPSRYTITADDLIIMGSETGVQDIEPEKVVYKGRLLPGKLLLVDMQEGRIIPDAEVKQEVCRRRPYSTWLAENRLVLDQSDQSDVQSLPEQTVRFLQRAFDYTREDINRILKVMVDTSQEPTSSMGTDTPLAVFSRENQLIYAYFKQIFAQVTNPPIDSIREDLVMTLTSFIGPQQNLLEETAEHCLRIRVVNPILTPAELTRLIALKPDTFASRVIDTTFYLRSPAATINFEPTLKQIVAQAVKAVHEGVALLICSDRLALNAESGRCAIPALLVVGAVHHALIAAGLRMKVSIIVESASPRELMHFALLFGYGADLVVPYGALAVIDSICDDTVQAVQARKHYLKALQKALLKVMSKMGTSTLRSYRGAQVFEAVGLAQSVIDTCFTGTVSRIGGVGFSELSAAVIACYQQAQQALLEGETILRGAGQYRWRKTGENHAWNPETIHLLQWAVQSGDYGKFKQFSAAADAYNKAPSVIRGLLKFKPASSLPLDTVESAENIMRRFTTGAMSFGSISREAHETIALAMNSIGGRSNSGEGGEDPARFGTQYHSRIKQVASGRFGVTSDYLANAHEIQIKIAQGAKPGEGGQLPGHKIDSAIAKTRNSTPGVTLISPPPHHDIYSIEDLAELIFDLKNANEKARISVKLVSESGVGTIAAGVAKAHADTILISGYDGGTGASPQSSIRYAGLPWEIGLAETQQVLVKNGLRGRVRLQTDGQLKTGRDVVIAGMLGAEEFGFGTSVLICLGCVMMRKCHENTCPAGIATQDPKLRSRFCGKADYIINFFRFLAEETREIMAALGVQRFDDLVGRCDLLEPCIPADPQYAGIDLSGLLHREPGNTALQEGSALFCVQDQRHKIDNVLDRELVKQCFAALDRKTPVSLQFPICNVNRAVGAMLSYEVSQRFGGRGLPENFVTVDFTGSAGQSFGAFLAKGITFRLSGDSNDYLGKGLSGGRIVVSPPHGSRFATQENIIIGNTVLYGATAGEVYIAGVAGERFCVRNSGAVAVVEGTGDHCAEYMTGGRVVILGKIGRNFAAGMSGGIAYVFDTTGNFEYFLNKSMVELSGIDSADDETFVKDQIAKHIYWTGSVYAQSILDKWTQTKSQFVKVLPVEYKRALQQIMLAELDRKLLGIREHEELTDNS
jgi:glutamate synthase (NADPH/NADH) large chain